MSSYGGIAALLFVVLLAIPHPAQAQLTRFEILHTFPAFPLQPSTKLVQATDGNFYGTTEKGGAGYGTVFRMTPAGVVTVLHAFLENDGSPQLGDMLIQAVNGDLYGTTPGTAFKVTTGGVFTTLHVFNYLTEGDGLSGGLVQATDGHFYGTAYFGGGASFGTIFRMTPAGTVTVLHRFLGGEDGAYPLAGLLQTGDGNFYGTTTEGGEFDQGTVYRMRPNGRITILHSFSGGVEDGSFPYVGRLLQATDGNFYGTTGLGGELNHGTIFRMTPAGSVTVLSSFSDSAEGAHPYDGLVQATDSDLYGTNAGNGTNPGIAFKITLGGTLTVLHTFSGGANGAGVTAGLIQAADGEFYGTTFGDGFSDFGSLFRMNSAGIFTVLQQLSRDSSGAVPIGLVEATDGNFYGTTRKGGADDLGTAFTITLAGSLSTVHTFTYAEDSFGPYSPLTQASDGNFYGSGLDVAFSMTPSGTTTLLHQFNITAEGYPVSLLMQAADGDLYGTTAHLATGGVAMAGLPPLPTGGAIFKMTPAGNVSVLRQFGSGSGSFGSHPAAGLIQASDGNFYGTTASGGAQNFGTVFQMTPAGTLTILHSFAGGTEGSSPQVELVQGTDGALYGAAASQIFKITLPDTLTVLHTLNGSTEGLHLKGALIQARDGNFYGMAGPGIEASGPSTIFKMTPTGTLTILHAFAAGGQGYLASHAALVQGSDGHFYGTTLAASGGGTGIIFRIRIGVTEADLDGDSKTDVAIYRPSTGDWWIQPSSTSTALSVSWGISTDVPVPGDYDGDGRMDIAIYRPSTGVWWILESSSNYTWYTARTLGDNTDVPVPADYDGDGKMDVGVYRPSDGTWFILESSTSAVAMASWGIDTDVPVAADYDGDGQADVAIYRPSTGEWWVLSSMSGAAAVFTWGLSGDLPVGSDYDGDSKIDPAVWRPSTGTWFILHSSANYATYSAINWGVSTDLPVIGDYDGDKKADIAVYRPSTGLWFILSSRTNYTMYTTIYWGTSADVPALRRP